jgi:hypothetical protein
MTTRARSNALDTPELDRSIEAAEAQAIVVWRGERIRFRDLPDRIARTEARDERDRLFAAYLEAVEALNPRYEERFERWVAGGDVVEAATSGGIDPRALAVDLERFVMHSETPYYAALRRNLALIDIEQGDATVADVWHIARGASWAHWFGEREVRRAVSAAGRTVIELHNLDGWLAAEQMLAGEPDGLSARPAAAVSAAYATLVGSPEWIEEELGVAAAEVLPFVDFAAFVRLWRLRRAIGELQYELRLFAAPDPALNRAYYSGIVGHMTGVSVPEEGYLRSLPAPFTSARELEVAILAADLVETLEARHGMSWWREPDANELVRSFAAASTVEDALAQLGYDALDWRPVLRQIRTRLIGEMSGYGGPNITTRAGTRKV